MNRIEHRGAVINAGNSMGNLVGRNLGRYPAHWTEGTIARRLNCGAIAIVQVSALTRNTCPLLGCEPLS